MSNLNALFDASQVGDRIALIDCRSWNKPEDYAYSRVNDLANACARGLLRRGLKRGSAVSILSSNRADFLIAYLGAMRAGLVATPVNFRFPPDTLDYDFIMRDAGVDLVLYDAECRTRLRRTLLLSASTSRGPEASRRCWIRAHSHPCDLGLTNRLWCYTPEVHLVDQKVWHSATMSALGC
jgi:acyl-CoA synthetase (AMP-forming)/AMP-acid ligase II